MNIVVPVKMVPDLVEELEVDATGRALDRSFLKLRINEFDEHALEEALLLKAKHGGTVTVLALDTGEVDETLFTCLAKGADRAIKITGQFQDGGPSHAAAAPVAKVRRVMKPQRREQGPPPAGEVGAGAPVSRRAKPETGGRAEILEG